MSQNSDVVVRPSPPHTSAARAAGPVFRRLSEVTPENLQWLWPGRFPLGKLTLIAGDPGLGKSFLTMDFAARVSSGADWPGAAGAPQPPGSVILFSAEDDLADTIRPRLDAAGADVARIHAVQGIEFGSSPDVPPLLRAFSLTSDLPQLEQVVAAAGGARLIVIDPISAFCNGADAHRDGDVRAMLAPLADLASRHRVAVVAVTHLTKSGRRKALYRAMGSLAFTAAARSVWLVIKDPANPARRLLLPAKHNLATEPVGMAFRIEDSRVVWEPEPVPLSADDALAAEAAGLDATTAEQEAIDLLSTMLRYDPIPAQEARALARRNGISEWALRRAKVRLKIQSRRKGFGNGSRVFWALPHHKEKVDETDLMVEELIEEFAREMVELP
jgi:putative DNA primase/helicase